MRIATWNVERLKHKKELEKIKNICNELNADIFVLSETDEQINLNHKNFFQTPRLPDKNFYKITEKRVRTCLKTKKSDKIKEKFHRRETKCIIIRAIFRENNLK